MNTNILNKRKPEVDERMLMSAAPKRIDLLSHDIRDWVSIPSCLSGKTSDAVVKFGNTGEVMISSTNGLWPAAAYIPDPLVYAPFYNLKLVYDLTVNTQMNILIFFGGETPWNHPKNAYIRLGKYLCGASIDMSSQDVIADHKTYRGEIDFNELSQSDLLAMLKVLNADDTICCSGIKVFSVANPDEYVVIRELSLVTK